MYEVHHQSSYYPWNNSLSNLCGVIDLGIVVGDSSSTEIRQWLI